MEDRSPTDAVQSHRSPAGVDEGLREIERAVADRYARLSPGQRRVIDHLLADRRYAAVVSGSELALELGVSESTVTRAAQALGFNGFPDLQARLRRRFVAVLPQSIEGDTRKRSESPEEAAIRVMLEDIERIRATADDLASNTLRAAVEALTAARRVYVFGARGSYGLAHILGIGLRLLLADVRTLGQEAGDLPDQLIGVDSRDALVAISSRRVDRLAVHVTEYARIQGVTTLAITDRISSPIARHAAQVLLVHSSPMRLTSSYAAAASLINALLTAVSLRTRAHAAVRLEVAEQLWTAFGTHVEED